MNFEEFFNSLSKSEQSDFAKKAGVSVVYLKMIASGERKPSADLSVVIERLSQGRVRCETLRPSFDWAYIRGTARSVAA